MATSLVARYEPFVAAAVLGAHANTLEEGFRQQDVRFMVEIFTNWVSSEEEHASLPIQNTQLARYIETLVGDGFARKLQKIGQPRYRLSRAGLVELIARVAKRTHFERREHFYFVYFFIEAYRPRIITLVRNEGDRFPHSLELELQRLMDSQTLLEAEVERTKQALRTIERRIDDTKKIRSIVEKLLLDKHNYRQILKQIDRVGFFGFTTQRRFARVFQSSTDRQGLWELQSGNKLRETLIWEPSKRMLEHHLVELEYLKSNRA